jgi:hypothetical protein
VPAEKTQNRFAAAVFELPNCAQLAQTLCKRNQLNTVNNGIVNGQSVYKLFPMTL